MYSSLYKIWKDENYLEDIQRLDDQLIEKIRKYVSFRKELISKTDEKIVKLIIEEELENVNFMLRDLFQIRTNKLFKAIQMEKKININFLTSKERKFYETTLDSFKNCSELFLSSAQGSKLEDFDKFSLQYVAVRILKEMAAIVGADLKTYGPFKVGDVVTLPEKNAKLLIERGAAREIKIWNFQNW